MNNRPPRHWIKRPPRPSRAPAPPPRRKPGGRELLLALGVGLAAGLLGASLAPLVTARAGMAGLLAGFGFCLGAVLAWRGFGGTLQDFRDYLR